MCTIPRQLPTRPGGRVLLATLAFVAGCGTDSSPLRVVPADPATLSVIAGGAQTGVVAAALPEPLVIEVRDRFDNPVPNAQVTWTVTAGGGSVPESTLTGNDGRATASWTLGTLAGSAQMATGSVAGVATATFTASAGAGPPADVTIQAGAGQTAPHSATLPALLRVRVLDAYDNPAPGATVTWQVIQGGGSLSHASSVTTSTGVATTGWTLGSEIGEQRVSASVDGAAAIHFTATATEQTITIAGAYLTQSTQTFTGSVPLVAGRAGYLRVFLGADGGAAGMTPTVEAHFYRGGALVQTLSATSPADGIPATLDEGAWDQSWNMAVPGSLLEPGTSLVIEAGGGTLERTLDVRTLPTFRARLIPVRHADSGLTGNVSDATRDFWLATSQAMFPFPGYDVDVRAPYTTTAANISTHDNWVQIIQEVRALQVAEGTGRYYYGVLRHDSPTYCGLGYLGFPTSIGTDTCGPSVAAHEFGHNFNRAHTPCGNPSGVDTNYPYPNARLGVWGLHVAAVTLKHPDQHADLMSYCGPEWISDYTYRAVMSWRETEGASAGLAAAALPIQPSLVVWGRIENGQAVVEPAFVVETRPRLPDASGPYTLELLDDAGGPIYALSFRGEELGHGDGDGRHFAFAIPLSHFPADRLRAQRVGGGGALPALRRSTGAAAGDAQLSVRRTTAGRARVEWNAAAFPLAVVRDPRTREILSLARGGSVEVATDAVDLEILVSEGVRSVRQQRRVAP